MLMCLFTGQHLIVEGFLEAEIQDNCHPYEEFQRKNHQVQAPFFIQSKFLRLGCLKLNQMKNEINRSLSNTNNLNCPDT